MNISDAFPFDEKMPPQEAYERMLEALLFATARPLSREEIAKRMPDGADVKALLAGLSQRYEKRGVHLVERGGGWAFRTAPEFGFLLETETHQTRKLSRAAIETLAIIAYHQPTTRAEIEEIRGVAVSRGTLDTLMERGWIKIGRRRESPGRPVTFAITPHFLDHFGLTSVQDLPGLRELRDSGLLERTNLEREGEEAHEAHEAEALQSAESAAQDEEDAPPTDC